MLFWQGMLAWSGEGDSIHGHVVYWESKEDSR
jgi:hypothetical protein